MKGVSCGNPTCNNTPPKNKYGVYKIYCSAECKKIGSGIKYENTYANKDMDAILAKRRATNIEKFGVDNASKNDEIRERLRITTTATSVTRTRKTKENNLERYGVESTNSLQSVKETKKIAFMEKYGVDHQLKILSVAASVSCKNTENSKERLGKAKITNIERYGCENPSSNVEVKQKRVDTMIDRFGVENASQNVVVHQKKMRSGYMMKEFIFPSGRVDMVQGYEPWALTELLKTYDEDDIITNNLYIPRIKYVGLDEKNHYYFPDIYIPKNNLIIEVKSLYTYSSRVSWLHTNLAKQKYTLLAGYNFNFMIYQKSNEYKELISFPTI
jgi:hypothetical protein